MTRPGPHHIGTKGATDGYALVYRKATDEYGPEAPPGVQTITAGTYVKVDATDPTHIIVTAMVPVTTTVGSVAQHVYDDDGHLIYSEAP